VRDSLSTLVSGLLRTNPETAAIIKSVEKYVPFLLIVAAKCFFDHATGILVFVALFITFYHANSVVKSEVSRKSRGNNCALVAVLVNLIACMLFIFFVFSDPRLFTLSLFIPLQVKVGSFSDLVWIVAINDFVLKFDAVITKILIVLSPQSVLPYRKRGNYFLFIEMASQLHRSLVPIQVWLMFLLQGAASKAQQGTTASDSKLTTDSSPNYVATVMGIVLMLVYVVVKSKLVISQAIAFKAAATKLWQCTRYGSCPSEADMKANGGGLCPICHDPIKEPAMLHCKHIFCEECVATWFDRERTCPMCRAQVTEDPAWRDGATSLFIQLF